MKKNRLQIADCRLQIIKNWSLVIGHWSLVIFKFSNFQFSFFFFLIFNFQFSIFNSFSQTSTNSPYSQFGLGEIDAAINPQNFALGRTGFAMNNPAYINLTNPASYASLDLTVFEVGASSNLNRLRNQTDTQKTRTSSFGYFVFGIPIKKWWGASFGLLPYSSTGYKLNTSEEITNIGTVQYFNQGSGGINKVYLGNGFKIKEILSIGVNASYLFGAINKQSRAIFDKSKVPFNTLIDNNITAQGFAFDFGIQYKQKINDEWICNVGGVYGMNTKLKAQNENFAATYISSNSELVFKDTLKNFTDTGKISLPQFFGFGFSVENGDKWLFAMDYSKRFWSDYSALGQNEELKNSSQISFGVQYCPERFGGMSFWKATQYRVGMRYADSYLQIKNIPIKEYGISFGLGMPLKKSRSSVNLGFEIGKRGTIENGLILEEFISAKFGLTINDRWFIKRKYD